MEELQKIENRQCIQELLELRDSFDALSSKWKLPILQYLYNRQNEVNNFRKIEQGINGISDKMLAKALKELEMNNLICKTLPEMNSTNMVYTISDHGKTAIPMIRVFVEWGRTHREMTKKLMGDSK